MSNLAPKSVVKMWQEYRLQSQHKTLADEPLFDFFCDNEIDANMCAELVRQGIKKATASSLWTIEKSKSKMPQVGDRFVVTDWHRNAICIVETTLVSIAPFYAITAEQAYREGEGDRSLTYWQRAHRDFFTRELKNFGLEFDESMPVVFEEFERVF